MESNPAVPGGSLTSKPTWSNTFGCSATPAFFVLVGRRAAEERFFAARFDIRENNDGMILYGDLPGAVTVHLPKSEKVKPRRIEVTCC